MSGTATRAGMTTRTMMKLCLSTIAAFALASRSTEAMAAGMLVDAGELTTTSASSLKVDIERARGEAPELFKAVRDIASRAGELDENARRQGTPLTMSFKMLGPRALMPMLEMLAFDAYAPKNLTKTAAAALEVGLVEAVGIIRDARALPVLARILEHTTAASTEGMDPVTAARTLDTTRAAADALGRLGNDDAFVVLQRALASAPAGSDRERAIVAGLGSCRRSDAARLLAQRLATHPKEETARALTKALGTIGNAWAWQTLSSRDEETVVRETAARALVDAYVSYEGDVPVAAANALLVVDAPQTANIVGEARRSASADLAVRLDRLSARLSRNPTVAPGTERRKR